MATYARVSQEVVEALYTTDPAVRISQEVVEVLYPSWGYDITGNIIENTGIATWRVVALDAVTGEFKQTTTSSSSTYTLPKPYTTSAVCVCYPRIDRIWTASTVVALNDFCVPADPDTMPKLYQATDVLTIDPVLPDTTCRLSLEFVSDFADGSGNNLVADTVSNAAISTTQYKYNGHSGYFAGNSYLKYNTGQGFGMSGDFGIQFWVFPLSVTGYQVIFDSRNGANGFYFGLKGAAVTSAYCDGGVGTIAINTWYHIEMDRVGTALKIYLDGEEKYSGTVGTVFTDPNLYIGRTNESASNYLNGYLASYAISTTNAFHSAAFTRPNAPLSALGVLPKTDASEPEWPVSGTVVDGDITWTYIADLIDPLAIGPRKPSS